MPRDEQDATFEKALSRHLRAECPDAETLAAYHECALAPEEMAGWKRHISGCGNCQEILAQLERTEGVAAETGADISDAGAAHDAHAVFPVAAGVAEQSHAHPVLRAVRKPATMPTPQRIRAWKWAAPTGAIAAGLLVWLSVSEWQRSAIRAPAPVQVAENRPQADRLEPPADQKVAKGEPAPLRREANESSEQKSLAKLKAEAPATRRMQTLAEQRSNAERQDRAKNAPVAEAGRVISGDKRADIEEKEQAESKDEITANRATQAATAGKAIGGVAQSVRVQPENAVPARAPVAPAPLPPAPAPAEGNRDARKSGVGGLTAQQEISGGIKQQYKNEAYLLDADASMLHTVVSADGKRTWRLGRSGQILLLDAKTGGWQAQTSGIKTALTSGSAPAEKICWVAGRESTILRTVDGGKHWRKISSPIGGDIGAITATDAKHATVWDAEKRASYETSDGGVTWTPRTP